MVLLIPTEKEVEKEILVTTKKEKPNKSFIQIINFLSQEPPTPVDWSSFEKEKEQNS